MFTVHLHPHHVWQPHAGVPEGGFWLEGGAPEPTHPHHVEVDCSTGRIGYTRLTDSEISEQLARAEEDIAARGSIEEEARARMAELRAEAKRSPAFAALLEHFGIPSE